MKYEITIPPDPKRDVYTSGGQKIPYLGYEPGVGHRYGMQTNTVSLSYSWEALIKQYGPFTDYPPYQMGQRLLHVEELDNLPVGTIVAVEGQNIIINIGLYSWHLMTEHSGGRIIELGPDERSYDHIRGYNLVIVRLGKRVGGGDS